MVELSDRMSAVLLLQCVDDFDGDGCANLGTQTKGPEKDCAFPRGSTCPLPIDLRFTIDEDPGVRATQLLGT
jgi:hypothetical protein